MADQIERDYARAINAAIRRGDNDAAHEFSVGLTQYQRSYKVLDSTQEDSDD
jgi:ABC-type taurine transport system substrate-binding protein